MDNRTATKTWSNADWEAWESPETRENRLSLACGGAVVALDARKLVGLGIEAGDSILAWYPWPRRAVPALNRLLHAEGIRKVTFCFQGGLALELSLAGDQPAALTGAASDR